MSRWHNYGTGIISWVSTIRIRSIQTNSRSTERSRRFEGVNITI